MNNYENHGKIKTNHSRSQIFQLPISYQKIESTANRRCCQLFHINTLKKKEENIGWLVACSNTFLFVQSWIFDHGNQVRQSKGYHRPYQLEETVPHMWKENERLFFFLTPSFPNFIASSRSFLPVPLPSPLHRHLACKWISMLTILLSNPN